MMEGLRPQSDKEHVFEALYIQNLFRKDAEQLLRQDGDFLVRESLQTPGQYVLTGGILKSMPNIKIILNY